MKKVKKAAFWFFSAFFFLGALAFMPSFASVLMLVLALLLAPINKLQAAIKKLFPKKWLKTVVPAALIIFALGCVPKEVTPEQQPPANNEEITQNEKKDFLDKSEAESEVTEPETTKPEPAVDIPEIPEDSIFEIHYIDVGQADSALVVCDGRYMLIDGGNASDSGRVYAYLKRLGAEHLDIMVATHAHEDHVGGLAGALNYATVGKVLCPVKEYDSDTFRSFVKYVSNRNTEISVPEVGDTYTLGSSKIDVLAVNTTDDTNNTSIVLKITYGNTSFLFTGDAEREVEQFLLNNGADLTSTVLKVGHHGSETSTSYVFLREIMPEYAVISVGKGNSYGHPTEEVLSRLRDADVTVFRTDMQGDIICSSDGNTVTFKTEKNESANTLDEVEKESEKLNIAAFNYILNTGSKKFHSPDCRSVAQMSEKNKASFSGTRDEIISQGFSPCGNCNP